MTKENPTIKDELEDSAEAAAQLEAEAKTETDASVYIHKFKKPVAFQGRDLTELTFDWGGLNGMDFLNIEDELLRKGRTLVMPEFTSDFLWRMAARACTLRDKNGVPELRAGSAEIIPLRDFRTICKEARSFLMRAES